MDVTIDELLGCISMKVFCPDPHRNLALRALAGDIVYQANLSTSRLSRKGKRYVKHFGPAGAVMLTALRGWFGDGTARCWDKLADLFEDSPYFSVLNHPEDNYLGYCSATPAPTPTVRLHVGMLIQEAAAARGNRDG